MYYIILHNHIYIHIYIYMFIYIYIYIYHVHPAYSISRKHIPCPYIIYHVHTAYSISREHIACPYSIFYPQKTYSMSIQHIPCLQSIHIASIYIPEGPDLKNSRFGLFPRFIPWPSGYVWASSLILFMGFSNFQKICFSKFIFHHFLYFFTQITQIILQISLKIA